MIPPFFDFDDSFARWLHDYAGRRPIFDLGCRTGFLVRKLRAIGNERVWGLDKFPQFEPDIEAFCTKMDVTNGNPLVRGPGKLLVIARPDHGGWTEKVLDGALSEVLYIGLERNAEGDLGDHFGRAERIEAPGMKPNRGGVDVWEEPTFLWRIKPDYDPRDLPAIKFWLVHGAWQERMDKLGPRGKPVETGGYWVNGMGGGYPVKPSDVIEATQIVTDYRELDMTRTDSYARFEATVLAERWPTGWIRPDGRFYSCDYMGHDGLAYTYLGYEVKELEAMRWARVVLINHKLYMHGGSAFDFDGPGETDAQIETFTRLEARFNAENTEEVRQRLDPYGGGEDDAP